MVRHLHSPLFYYSRDIDRIDLSTFLKDVPLSNLQYKLRELIRGGEMINNSVNPSTVYDIESNVENIKAYRYFHHDMLRMYFLWKIEGRRFFDWHPELFQDVYDEWWEYDSVPQRLVSKEKPDFPSEYAYKWLENIQKEVRAKLKILRTKQRALNTPTVKDSALKIIHYNSKTGTGSINDKDFKFNRGKKGGMMFRLFDRLYENINQPINRYDVLEAISFYEAGQEPDSNNSTLETKAISNITTKIREKTGLSTHELVVNNGDVTLLGRKE
jgi:hypothetical protein